MWPPLDPDRIFRYERPNLEIDETMKEFSGQWTASDVESFNKRKVQDLQRQSNAQRRQPFHTRFQDVDGAQDASSGDDGESDNEGSSSGEEGWRNSEGERLGDFGVDEETEFYDEDVALSELLRRRRPHQSA